MSLIKNLLPENMDEIFPDDTDIDYVEQALKKMEEESQMEEAYFASIH